MKKQKKIYYFFLFEDMMDTNIIILDDAIKDNIEKIVYHVCQNLYIEKWHTKIFDIHELLIFKYAINQILFKLIIIYIFFNIHNNIKIFFVYYNIYKKYKIIKL